MTAPSRMAGTGDQGLCTVADWTDLQLAEHQGAVIDALVESGMDRDEARQLLLESDLGQASETTLDHVLRSLALLDAYAPGDDPAFPASLNSDHHTGGVSSLVSRTLGRITEAEQARVITPERAALAAAMAAGGGSGQAETAPSNGRTAWLQVGVAVAAVMLIGSVSFPMIERGRAYAERLACQGHMGQLAQAFDGYASDYQDALPLVEVASPGDNWLTNRQASANLLTLGREGYVTDPQTFTCPSNRDAYANADLLQMENWPTRESTSFSYQHLAGPNLPTWGGSQRMALVSDRSPVVTRLLRNEPISPSDRSPCHGSKGQNVMFNDGSAEWMTESSYGVDHLWLPDTVTICDPLVVTGTEYPAHAFDSMLVN